MSIKLGLVLHDRIGYSETFFRNDLRIYHELGIKTIIFTNYHRYKSQNERAYIYGLPNKIRHITDIFYCFKIVLKFLTSGLIPAYRLFKLERQSGTSLKRTLKNIIINAHILSYRLSYLHFGFGTCSINRELVAKAIGAKMTVSFRGYDIKVFPLEKENIYSKLLSNTFKIHTISKCLAQSILPLLNEKDAPSIHIIKPSVNEANITIKRNIGQLSDPIKILTVGRFHWKKGYQYALPAIRKLLDNGISIKYTIIGDGETKPEILYLINNLRLENVVELKGVLTHQQVQEHMQNSDIYLQCSIQEGFCNSVLEAQANGLLVISTDADGIDENIKHNETGWIIPKMDIDAIVNQVINIISIPASDRIKVAQSAHQRVGKEFTMMQRKSEWQIFFS